MNNRKLKLQGKINFGFYKFAWLPTLLTSGEIVWFKKYFIAGKKFGCYNRYSVGHKQYELRYLHD